MTLTDRIRARPSLPEGAGKHTIRLDLELTREDLAVTVRQLLHKLNVRRLVKEYPGGALAVALALVTVTGSVIVHAANRRYEVERQSPYV